ncbi:uncharacterized protein LOC132257874 [Phlebotomus argentipes]|uniref:uncharacterized protein LOC132257874 n=1 Tax=Phlebotomus argentipes TaxID=94469 RepID=UPI002893784A|nr:uncharacterized protein LOC132257874 [Phlebotomus argentipes]
MCLKQCSIVFVVCCLLSAVTATPLPHHRDTSIADKMTWSCVNNASCIDGAAKQVTERLSRKESVDFGVFKVVPLERKAVVEGRSSNFLNFLSGNAVRIPLGPVVFSIQQSEDHSGYLEVSLLRKGRHHKHRPMRLFIPSFLAFNAVGWMMLAITSVALLTFKAFALSKIAFLVAAAMTFRRVMGHGGMEHPEYLPYNGYELDSPLSGAVASGSEFLPYHISPDLQAFQQQQQQQNPLAAESNIVAAVEAANNATSPLVPQIGSGLAKIKRQDLSDKFLNLQFS